MIKVENLSLKVKGKTILDNISFEVNSNQIIGLLGHNAAGKSTLQRYIANEEVLQEGNIYINGIENSFSMENSCVLITEKLFLHSSLTIEKNLKYCNSFELLDVVYVKTKLDEFNIDLYSTYGSLSRGNKQIVHILFCLAKKADIYLMDEPLSTVDIFNRKKIADLILDAQQKGATVVITTHLINEFQMLFDRILYLNNGKLDYDISIEEVFEKGYQDVESFIIDQYGGNHNA